MKKVNAMRYGMRKKENKGFSLIELIIAIAILAIISISIVVTMTTSSRVYSRSSVEAQMQSEAQLLANAISEIAIDASNASNEATTEWLSTLSGTDNASLANVDTTAGQMLVLDATENVGTVTAPDYRKVQYLVTRSKDTDVKEMYLAKRQQDTSGAWSDFGEFHLLGNYVGSFMVNVDRVEKDNLLVFSLGYEKNEREYSGNYQVMMRNKAYSKAEPEETQSEKDIKLIANIQPKYVYLAVKQGTIPEYYEGAVLDAAPYKKSIIQPVTFRTTFVTNQSENLLRSKWELTGTGNDGLFTLATANPAEGAANTLITSNSLNINATKEDLKSLSYDFFNVNYSISTTSKEGTTVTSDLVSSQVRFLRIKGITLAATSGFSREWKTGWNGSPTDGVDGYAYTDASGKVVDMGLNAMIDCTEWVPYKGGVIWRLEKWDGSAWKTCDNANFAKLAISESPNSTLNTLQFGPSAMNGQKYKITAISKFDEDYSAELIIGVGQSGGGNNDGFYSRGFYVDITAWLEQEKGVTTVVDKIQVDVRGDSWENAQVEFIKDPNTGRWYMYVNYDSFAYTQQSQRKDFYNGKGEFKFYVKDASGNNIKDKNNQELIEYHMKAVVVTKSVPTNEVLVVPKGGSKDVTVKTSYYNLISKDYFGIFVNDTETNLNRAGMTDWDKYLKVETSSAYGDVYNYVDEMKVTVTPKTGSKEYNPCPMRLRLAALDYYNLTRNNSTNPVSYDSPTYTDYIVYVANVEGANVFIPCPGTKGDDATIDGKGITWPSDVSSTKVSISGYDANGNVVTDMGKVYTQNGRTKLDYNGTTYTYNSTYHYWKK